MVQLCPRCQRANPDQAVFCHFDGYILRQGAAGAAGAGQLLQEFIFPSGRRCRTFDELAQGCYNEWEAAREMLRDGNFASFLAGVGRADLARAAREAMSQSDPDIALTNFVSSLPAGGIQGPRLGLSPRKLVVGPIRVGEQRSAQVNLLNEGQGLLQGKVTVSEGQNWLQLADEPDPATCAVKTAREQSLVLRADTSSLTVGQNYAGKLMVVTNGGVAEVPIRLDLVARPFARGPYAGAGNPRDLAKRMSKDPKPAVGLLENGEIRRWFESNGWAYPVAGTPATGLAAVQQFFEEMGLAKPPPISLSEQEFRFRCTPPEVVSGQVSLRTSARRIVYGRVESDSPWLKVQTPSVAGDFQAQVGFEIDSSLLDGDQVYQGNLKIVANAGQAFNVRVQVEVQGGKKGSWFRAAAPAAPAGIQPAPVPVPAPAAPVLRPVNPPAPPDAAPAPSWLPVQPLPVQPPPPPPSPAPAAAATIRQVTAVPAPSTVRVTAQPQPVAVQLAPAPAAPALQRAPAAAGLGQCVLVGAILGLLFRLVLFFPADLFARLLGSSAATGKPVPGSLIAWLQTPAADETFLRLFVLATWWVGALAGALLVWRAGGRILDLVCGLLAGAVLGLAGCATLGCLLVLGDELPRLLLRAALGERALGAGLATPLWLLTAVFCWVVLGAGLGLVLGALGGLGTSLLAGLARPVSGLLRLLGLSGAADFFALRGG